MTIEERKLTPAGQGNLQQIKLGIPVVEALNRMAEDPMGENEKLLLRFWNKIRIRNMEGNMALRIFIP